MKINYLKAGSMVRVRAIKTGLNNKIIAVVAFLIIFSSLAFLVYQLNTYTAEIYFTYKSKKDLVQLSQKNKMLEVGLARANSLWNIEEYAQNFEKNEKIEYVRILEDTVLAK
jgi:hypothetical protein